MKELIEKVSSYNLFNYLFPGIVYVVVVREISSYDLYQNDNLTGVFLYYFIGLVISRFGSLVIEPILQKSSFVKFTDYKEYVSASSQDEKIELFSQINNMYRTIISLLLLVLLTKMYELLAIKVNIPQELSLSILILCLLIIFVFSYRKQTGYIVKRVDIKKT